MTEPREGAGEGRGGQPRRAIQGQGDRVAGVDLSWEHWTACSIFDSFSKGQTLHTLTLVLNPTSAH